MPRGIKGNRDWAAYRKQWRADNPEKCKANRNHWRLANPERYLWMTTRNRALRLGIPFSLEVTDINIPTVCPVLGIQLSKGTKNRTDASPSIDKIVPELGYVKGNVQVISMRANRIKNDGSATEHEAIAKYIKEHGGN